MKIKLHMLLVLMPLVIAALLSGCAANISPNNYNVASVGDVNRVIPGIIVGARPVRVSGNNSGVGAVGGAVAGGVAGSAIGNGARAGILGAVGGALAGGLLGNAIERGVSRQTGIEYIVKTKRGHMLSIVQGPQPQLEIGEHVLVLLGERSRIIPDRSFR